MFDSFANLVANTMTGLHQRFVKEIRYDIESRCSAIYPALQILSADYEQPSNLTRPFLYWSKGIDRGDWSETEAQWARIDLSAQCKLSLVTMTYPTGDSASII